MNTLGKMTGSVFALILALGIIAYITASPEGISPHPGPSPAAAATCPAATPEPLWVEPVTSPTDLPTQTITVRLGNGEAITISAESGVFAVAGDFDAYTHPALITMALLSGVTHHLSVKGKVKFTEWNGCVYGGYTLSTQQDKNGKSLVIIQTHLYRHYLPMLLKRDSAQLR